MNAFNWDEEYEKKFYLDNIEYFASLLKPIKDCQKYIRKLKEEGNEIYIITGRDNGEYSDPYNMTVNWLKENNIYYDKLFLVDAYNSNFKTEMCLKYKIDVMKLITVMNWVIIKKILKYVDYFLMKEKN